MQINSSPGPRTGTHPLSGSRDPGERGALAPCSEAVSRDPGERGALAPCFSLRRAAEQGAAEQGAAEQGASSKQGADAPRSPSIPIDLRLHVAADAAMIDVVQFITHLAESLGGYWEYHAPLSANPGRFEFHHLTFPHSEIQP